MNITLDNINNSTSLLWAFICLFETVYPLLVVKLTGVVPCLWTQNTEIKLVIGLL